MLAAASAAAIWGGMYVVSRVVLVAVPPLPLVAIRMALAAAALFGWLALSGRPLGLPREIRGRVIAMGLVGNALSIAAQFQGTALAGAAVGSLVTTAAPVVTVALSAAFGRERVGGRAWAGLALGLAGVAVLSGGGRADPAGVAWLVLAAVTWGLLGLIGGEVVARHDAALVTAWASLVGGLGVLPAALLELTRRPLGEVGLVTLAGIAYLGLVSTALAFALWVYGVSRAGSVRSGLAYFAQPAVGALLGWAVLGEPLNAGFFAGAALLGAGAALAVLGRGARLSKKPRPGFMRRT